MYRLLLMVGTQALAHIYMPIEAPKPKGLLSLVVLSSQLLSGLFFYLGLGMIATSVYRYAEYRSTRAEPLSNIVTLAVIGLCFAGLSFIQFDASIQYIKPQAYEF